MTRELTLAGILTCVAAAAGAQMPGLPVLQNAFANPGLTAAANFGSGNRVASYAVSAGWVPGNGRLQFSGGLGLHTARDSTSRGSGTGLAYGARAMMPLMTFSEGSFGVAGFAGLGGAIRSGARSMRIPVGGAVGWRKAIGETRGVSLHAAPMVVFSSGQGVTAKTLVRFGTGADLGITPSIGVTVGVEGGQGVKLPDGTTDRQSLAGIGVSYVLGRRPTSP